MKHDLSAFGHLILSHTPFDPIVNPNTIQVRGTIILVDQSVLYVRENYVIRSGWIDYSYHWQAADNQIIHRWDNAHSVPLPTTPYHQHQGSEENVVASEPMTLDKVLTFIASQLTVS
ncbi:hypothetical protein DYU11_10605 [Fibrisoma montanum]|uniref:Uncharacterized protein n=1 Tax=Fibrisoma montanum TaxID=2305895 RepID=A0A418MAR8_9BACT|nr:DUF6516 family protein [Fibrisoma montanum]RIV23444.1 hypothetical protein DYU11_10605 [Fibrisoma montanum]